MRFAIDVQFVSKDGRVLSVRSNVRPGRVAAAFRAFAVIELPARTSEAGLGRAMSRRPVRLERRLTRRWRVEHLILNRLLWSPAHQGAPDAFPGTRDAGAAHVRVGPPWRNWLGPDGLTGWSHIRCRSIRGPKRDFLSFHWKTVTTGRIPSKALIAVRPLLSCMAVADRRRDKRFRLTEPAAGALRVFPDVVVHQDGTDEWIGISRQPAFAGETLVLDVVQFDAVEGEIHRRLPVWVIESRPVIVDGDMRHRIRLHGGIMASVGFEQQVRRG